jgi:group I intron endonuclease
MKVDECLKGIIGIYILYINDKVYIGKSTNLYKRLIQHYCDLKRGDHSNDYLQKSYNKHIIISYNILIKCTEKELSKYESFFINKFDSNNRNFGYNLNLETDQKTSLSKETKIKLRNYNLGKKLSKKTKLKISNSLTGVKRSKKVRENIANGKIGNKNPMFGKIPNNSIKIEQYDLENKLLNTFETMTEASEKTKVPISTIGNVIHGRTKKPRNFIWKIKNN